MFKDSDIFSGFSVDNVPAGKGVLRKTLGLVGSDDNGMLTLKLGGVGPCSSIRRARRTSQPASPC